jgi:hypothetical protein
VFNKSISQSKPLLEGATYVQRSEENTYMQSEVRIEAEGIRIMRLFIISIGSAIK